ncbi:MAG: helix-turn-helix domain-containing protein [Methylococcaceae bacterium]
MSLGYKIKSARELLGMSQTALALECGWQSQSRIGNYEMDLREPSFGDLRKIAKALHQPIVYFLKPEEGNPEYPEEAEECEYPSALNESERAILKILKTFTKSQQQGILNEIKAVYETNEEVVATYKQRSQRDKRDKQKRGRKKKGSTDNEVANDCSQKDNTTD